MQRQLGADKLEIVVARRGEQIESDDPDVRFLVLHEGRRYEGIPGTSRFRVVEFLEHGIPYQLPSLEQAPPTPRAMPFGELLKSDALDFVAEVQWRLGIPLATIILSIIAVPLAKTQPRAGRYGRLAVGLLVFIIYLNLLSAARAWIEQGVLVPYIGLWAVHGGMFSLALLMLGAQSSVHRRLWR